MYKESDTFKVCSDEELPKEGTFTFEHIFLDIQPEEIIFYYKLIE
jgi:hypothetical protein